MNGALELRFKLLHFFLTCSCFDNRRSKCFKGTPLFQRCCCLQNSLLLGVIVMNLNNAGNGSDNSSATSILESWLTLPHSSLTMRTRSWLRRVTQCYTSLETTYQPGTHESLCWNFWGTLGHHSADIAWATWGHLGPLKRWTTWDQVLGRIDAWTLVGAVGPLLSV